MTDVPAGCIPLGTGNDSSRAFGWGYKFGGKKKLRENVERMRTTNTFVKWDRWHLFAQYEEPVSESFAQHLPASVTPVHSREELPEFYRHPKQISLPPVPSQKQAKKIPPAETLPRPHRAASIDSDARAEGYNVAAVPLAKRLAAAGIDPASSPAPVQELSPIPQRDIASAASASAAAVQPASLESPPSPERGPGFTFGGQFNNYLSWGQATQKAPPNKSTAVRHLCLLVELALLIMCLLCFLPLVCFSPGIDAQIQNQFHVSREACRVCFCCRPCNMAWMGQSSRADAQSA